METLAQWHVALGLIAGLRVVSSLFATALEQTTLVRGRGEFGAWLLGAATSQAIVGLSFRWPEVLPLALLIELGVSFTYQQMLVGRLRVATHGKTLAYPAVVPVLGLFIGLYALLRGAPVGRKARRKKAPTSLRFRAGPAAAPGPLEAKHQP